MQNTKVLYTANERKTDWVRVFRWVDVLAFVGILLAIGGLFWVAMTSNNPTALRFVRITTWGMGIAIGILSLMLMLNAFGRWGWLGLIPLVLLGMYWSTGSFGEAVFTHWGEILAHRGGELLKMILYVLGGLTGLGLLARLIDKVGVGGFLATLAIATGISLWLIG